MKEYTFLLLTTQTILHVLSFHFQLEIPPDDTEDNLGVFGHQLLVLLPEGVHSVNHLLDQLNLRVSQSVLVRNVVRAPCLATGFSPGAAGLELQFLTPSLQCRETFLGPTREVHMYRGPHSGA